MARWLVAFATLVAFALRTHRLAAQSLWSDEDITLDRAGQSLADLIAGLPVEHAPLYFVVVRLWALVAGDGDLALRWPSLAFGVLAVPLGAYVGRRLTGPKGGMVAAVLLAVSPFLVWYGQEARMYSLVAALSLAAVAAVLRAETTGLRRWWVAAGALAALCVYAHYYGVLLVAVLTTWGVLDVLARRRAAVAGWMVAGLTALVLFAPWLARALRVAEFPGWRDPEPVRSLVWSAARAWSAGPTAPPEVASWATILYLALAAIGLVHLILRAAVGTRGLLRSNAVRLLLYAGVPLAIVAMLLLRQPDFHPRYFFAALPAIYLLVAAGAAALPRPATLAVTALLVVAAALPLARLYDDPTVQKQDYRAVIGTVEAATGSRDGLDRTVPPGAGDEDADEFGDTTLLLDGPPFGMMERYRSEESPVRIVNLRSGAMAEMSDAERDAEIARRAASYPHIWLATDGAASGHVAAWLDAHAFPVAQTSIQQLTLSRYFYPGPPDADHADPAKSGGAGGNHDSADDAEPTAGVGDEKSDQLVQFVDGETYPLPVHVMVVMPATVAAGDVLPVELSWSPTAEDIEHLGGGELKVAVRLVQGWGDTDIEIARADRRPANWTRPTSNWRPGEIIVDRHGLIVPQETVPGPYDVYVVMYREDDPDVSWPVRFGGPAVTTPEPPR